MWRSASGCMTKRWPPARTSAYQTSSTRPLDEGRARPIEVTTMPKSTLVTDDRHGSAPTSVEAVFAEVLADVLRVDKVSVDSHFFEELGADSLVMAHFCARVRKRGDLPSVSMKDVYAHPTIRSLAEALADAVPMAAKPPLLAASETPTPTSAR